MNTKTPRFAFAALLLMTVAALLAGASASMAADMTLEQVLEKHYEAIGGKDAWKKVENMVSVGKMMMGPMEAPMTVTVVRPNKMRMEFEVQGMKAVQAYNGEEGWQIMPFQGSTDPTPMDQATVDAIKNEGDLEGPLVDWAEKGHKVELVGKDEFEGTAAYHLKLNLKGEDDRTIDVFLDAEYFVPIGRRETRAIPGMGEVEVTTSVSDYKDVGGLMIAHSTTASTPMGEQSMTFSEIKINDDIDAAIFEMPKADGE